MSDQSKLAGMSRPKRIVHYDRWGRDVPMRPISARRLVDLQRDYAELMDGEHKPLAHMTEMFAELLAATVQEPCVSAEEWLEEASIEELTELGQLAMEVSGIGFDAQKKSDASAPSIDSRSS